MNNSEDNPPKAPPNAAPWAINTAAELALYLIVCLPEESDRLQRVRDFVRLYHIEEKRPVDPARIPQSQPATWSDEQLKAITEHQQGLRGLGRIAPPEPKR